MNMSHYPATSYITPGWKLSDSDRVSKRRTHILGCGNGSVNSGCGGGWNTRRRGPCCGGKRSFRGGCRSKKSCGSSGGGYYSSNQVADSCKCSGDGDFTKACERKTFEGVYASTPVCASTPGYAAGTHAECFCSMKLYVLAIVVAIFVNPLFGIVAFYMAYNGKNKEMQGLVGQCRIYFQYSFVASIIGIITTSLTIVILAILHFWAKVI